MCELGNTNMQLDYRYIAPPLNIRWFFVHDSSTASFVFSVKYPQNGGVLTPIVSI